VFDNSPCFERVEDKEFYTNKAFEVLSKKYDHDHMNENMCFFSIMLYSLFLKRSGDDASLNNDIKSPKGGEE